MENPQFNLSKVIDDAIKVITQPVDFYRSMPKTGGYVEPVIFVVVMAVAMGLVLTIFSLFGGGRLGGLSMGLASVIIMPIMAVIGSFVAGAILFVIWKLMGSQEPFETAYRCIAYASAVYPVTAVLSLIPYLGTVVGIVWGIYLMITASVEVHQLAKNTAYIVFGIIGALLLFSNISGEMAARRLESRFAGMTHSMDKRLQNMNPEQAGKAAGEFLKGLEQGLKDKKQ